MNLHNPIPIEDIQAARERIKGAAIRTPLVRLNVDDAPAEIYLKLENLQPTGAFKLRGAVNAMRLADPEQLDKGVWTISSGNMALSLAWCAREFGLECTVVVPDDVPEIKLATITGLGANFVKCSFDELIKALVAKKVDGLEGLLVHPFSDPAIIAGQGTIGLEILDDLPDVDAVITPYGGGGLSCGVASAIRVLKPDTQLYACEVESGAPLHSSLAAGKPVEVEFSASFVSGIGAPIVFPEMFSLAKQLLDGSIVVTLDEVASAVKLVAERNHVIAEGAGATSVAAALSGKAGSGKVVCVVSGGNIDTDKLARILEGQTP